MLLNTLHSELKQKVRTQSFWTESFLLLTFTLSFAPIFMWFAEKTLNETRLLHSFITLAIAVILLIQSERTEIKKALSEFHLKFFQQTT